LIPSQEILLEKGCLDNFGTTLSLFYVSAVFLQSTLTSAIIPTVNIVWARSSVG
jgi:hypothetical protein